MSERLPHMDTYTPYARSRHQLSFELWAARRLKPGLCVKRRDIRAAYNMDHGTGFKHMPDGFWDHLEDVVETLAAELSPDLVGLSSNASVWGLELADDTPIRLPDVTHVTLTS